VANCSAAYCCINKLYCSTDSKPAGTLSTFAEPVSVVSRRRRAFKVDSLRDCAPATLAGSEIQELETSQFVSPRLALHVTTMPRVVSYSQPPKFMALFLIQNVSDRQPATSDAGLEYTFPVAIASPTESGVPVE